MKLIRDNILFFHLFLLAVQVLLFGHYLSHVIYIAKPDYFFYDAVGIYFNRNKPAELIEYIIEIVLLGLFFLSLVLGERKADPKIKRLVSYVLHRILNSKRDLFIYLILFVLLPLLIYFVSDTYTFRFTLQSVLLAVGISFPFWRYLVRNICPDDFLRMTDPVAQRLYGFISSKKYVSIFVLLLIFGVLQLGYLFYDPIFNKPKIINEYFNIPETTYMQNGEEVDNTSFWRQTFLSSTTNKSDVRFLEYSGNCLDAEPRDFGMLRPNAYENSNTYFHEGSERLCFNGDIDVKQFYTISPELYSVLQENADKEAAIRHMVLSPDAKQFLNSNEFELNWRILSRFMIHHNSFVFIPISELYLGKNINEINAQYGLGSIWVFQKILSIFGEPTFDGWLKLAYSFYYIYFFFFVVISYVLTKSLRWTTMIFLASLSLLNLKGYEFLLLPPGDSPWRHFFDIFIVYSLYLFGDRRQIRFWVFALFLSLWAVFLNPQIGSMMLLATIMAGLFFAFWEKQPLLRFALIAALFLGLGGLIFVKTSSANDLAKYYLDGVIGFPIHFNQLLYYLIFFVIGYIVFWKILKEKVTNNYTYLIFLFLYVQGLLLYAVWHYDSAGLRCRSHIYIMTIGLMIFTVRNRFSESWKAYSAILLIGYILFSYTESVKVFDRSKKRFEFVFSKHRTYQWDMDRAHIISTMNPLYFQNGVDLINKYSTKKNGIYIISEYDNFLPFLAGKYSNMPFFDLKWYLMTPKELSKSIVRLQTDKPEYIFVDTDIDRNLNNEIIDAHFPKINYLHNESLWRVKRLKLLNNIFQKIAENYELIEKGYLISVYKRKALNEVY